MTHMTSERSQLIPLRRRLPFVNYIKHKLTEITQRGMAG